MARRPAVQPGQPPLLHPRRGQPARARASSALPANAASGPWRAANGSQPAWHGGQTQPALAAAAPCAARLPAQRSGVAVGPCRPVRSSRRVDRRSSMCRRPCSHWCSSLEIAICFRASRDRRSRVGDQVIWFFEFYEAEDPEHLFGEGCLWCNLCSGKEEGVEADLQEFQDFDEFEN
ncbi:uncharacterized protein LOC100382273 [Zea mays]|uniref:Uncharacterized protein n=1 Tax=Zea mays TaxID=4577 RepID=C0P5Z7_MAIZE|nr:uncharacterized protein LOC100382273 [Zea mays]ACN28413.1 unknown [Zea mays]|eukprot:NP_001168495.1 uncharacterized protein LOC100382273 [Zea mays]